MAGAMIGGMLGIIGDICTIVTLGLDIVPCFAGGVGGGMALGTGALIDDSGGYIFVSNKDDIIVKYKLRYYKLEKYHQ